MRRVSRTAPHGCSDQQPDELTRWRGSMLAREVMLGLATMPVEPLAVLLWRHVRLPAPTTGRAPACRAVLGGVGLLTVAGCSSETLPPALSGDQLKAIAETHFKATVGVRRYNAPVYSDYLIEYLRNTQLFDEVAPLEAFRTPPTFVAQVDRGIYGTATIPIFTISTFGIVPTIVEEEHGLEVSLVPGLPPEKPIAIKFSSKGPSTLGWSAFYRAFLPNETLGPADWRARFVQRLALHGVQHKGEISAYAK